MPQSVEVHEGPSGAMPLAFNPASTITVFADDSTCTDALAVVAEGSAAAFEGPGIELTVPLAINTVTTLYANQSDLSGTSECSPGLPYRQVTGPPPVPDLLSVNPSSPADDNTPLLLGAATDGSTVSIYTNSACSGTAVASGSAADLSTGGIEVPVPDNSTTTFHATASWAGFTSTCSASAMTYQEVTLAPGEGPPPVEKPLPPAPAAAPGAGALPAPRLRTIPAGRANNNTPLVAGAAPGAASIRIYGNDDCAGAPLAKGPASQLAAGFPVQVGDNSTTRFYGVAYDSAGRPSSCSPNPAVYVEDSTPPLTRITLGPGVKTRARKPVFRFTDITEEVGTSFSCRLDKGIWRPCQTPWRAPRLRAKAHTVRIKAVDAAGNTEAGSVLRRFRVIAVRR